MSKQAIEKYGAYSITYNVEESRFEVEDEEEGLMHAETLKAMRARLDRIGQEQRAKQTPQKAISVEIPYTDTYNVSFKEASVGAFGMYARWSGLATLHAWVTVKGAYKERERVDLGKDSRNLFVEDTPENREILAEAIAHGKETAKYVSDAKKKSEAILKRLTKVKPKIAMDKLPRWER